MKDFSYPHEKKEYPQTSTGEGSSLPSRKITHPKPKSFFEKPLFSFLLFLLFLLLLLFLYYYFYQKGEALSIPFFHTSSDMSLGSDATEPDPAGKEEGSKVEKASLNQPSQNASADHPTKPPVPALPAGDSGELKKENQPVNPSLSDQGKNTSPPEVRKSTKNTKKGSSSLRYVVKDDDTLFRIAMRFYGSQKGIDRIRIANKIKGDMIYAGETLTIPDPVYR